MRIDSFQNSQNIDSSDQVTRKQDKKAVTTQNTTEQEGVTLSPQLKERLANTPDVRQERVDAIKQARAAGTYNVSDSQLADSMFKEFFNRG
ncbi:MAG TPA: flagellar biosynthesis anti-sigma factor FlgM [Candidatus Angelobacter sp.]|nr:flagellar biosynthesis anti-sigma factor FlgM [Candidatus Angelobacter sp.]